VEYHGGLVDGGLFDAITLFHVLEHLRNPKAVMEELVKSNLKDGGLLVIEVPNFGSLQSKIAGKY
jgi:2-polyprenyl-3-methyl-5-hydroxy-6-metoxy-1,4-benzoquinol methylase